jgi:hypothetical protein
LAAREENQGLVSSFYRERRGERALGREEWRPATIKCHQWRWPIPWSLPTWRRGSGGGEEEGGVGRFEEASGRGGEGAPVFARLPGGGSAHPCAGDASARHEERQGAGRARLEVREGRSRGVVPARHRERKGKKEGLGWALWAGWLGFGVFSFF